MRLPNLRLCFLATACLAIGFVAGRESHRPANTTPLGTPPADSIATTTTATSQPAIAGRTTQAALASPATHLDPAVTERLNTLRWLKSNQIIDSLQLLEGSHLSPKFAQLYDLSPIEIAGLNHALDQAKQRLAALSSQYAQLDPATTSQKLIVTVPLFPTEGNQVYSDLLAAFTTVLGAERYTSFDNLSGDTLEHALNRFGLQQKRIEVTLGKDEAGGPWYRINESFAFPDLTDPEGRSHSMTSQYNLPGSRVRISIPALKTFPLPTVATP